MRVLLMKMCHLPFTKSLSNNDFKAFDSDGKCEHLFSKKKSFFSEMSMVHFNILLYLNVLTVLYCKYNLHLTHQM